MMPLPGPVDLYRFLGWTDVVDMAEDERAWVHLDQARASVWAYTRGRGFSEGGTQAAEPILQVILSAAARSISNPTQARRIEAGSYNEAPGSLASFSLLETLTLNGYRRRAAGV